MNFIFQKTFKQMTFSLFFIIIGLFIMTYHSGVNAEEYPLKAQLDIKNEGGFLEIKPMITWEKSVTEAEAESFSYQLLSVKKQSGNRSRSTQKGSIARKSVGEAFSVSSSKTNHVADAVYEFSLKIYQDDELIIEINESL